MQPYCEMGRMWNWLQVLADNTRMHVQSPCGSHFRTPITHIIFSLLSINTDIIIVVTWFSVLTVSVPRRRWCCVAPARRPAVAAVVCTKPPPRADVVPTQLAALTPPTCVNTSSCYSRLIHCSYYSVLKRKTSANWSRSDVLPLTQPQHQSCMWRMYLTDGLTYTSTSTLTAIYHVNPG